MEAACNTLREASGLSSLFQRADDLFNSGDLVRIADALQQMKRGLSVVGDSLPEFRGADERLNIMEERFATLIDHPLSTAFTQHNGPEVASLACMLDAINRRETVNMLYASARMVPLSKLWEEGYPASGGLVSWLASYYQDLHQQISSEIEWCAQHLPDRHPGLVLSLLSSYFMRIEKPYRQRLSVALATTTATTTAPAPATVGASSSSSPASSSALLEAVLSETENFAKSLYHLFMTDVPQGFLQERRDSMLGLYSQLIAPLEPTLVEYAEIEATFLSEIFQEGAEAANQALFSHSNKDNASSPLEDFSQTIIDQPLAACETALERSVLITGGLALPSVVKLIDQALQRYLSSIQSSVADLSQEIASSSSMSEDSVAPSVLLVIESSLTKRVTVLKENIHQLASESITLLNTTITDNHNNNDDTTTVPSLISIRLTMNPDLKSALAALLATSTEGGSTIANSTTNTNSSLLPSSSSVLLNLQQTIKHTTLDALLSKIKPHLASVPGLSEWNAQPPSGGPSVPTFTPYPLSYMTCIGEHLMLLPQMLENALLLMGNINDENGDGDGEGSWGESVAEWLEVTVLAAAEMVESTLRSVTSRGRLSALGRVQLGADLEYFMNVLTTLGVDVPSSLNELYNGVVEG
jgi:conserved oligomeric Golgi complex subunit 7